MILVATITTTIDLDENAFTFQVDPKTGKRIMNLNQNLMDNYGLDNVELEQVTDETTGQMVYRMKPTVGKDGKVYELITDPKTGSKKGKKRIGDMMDGILCVLEQSLQVRETVTQQEFANIVQSKKDMKTLTDYSIEF